MGLRYHAFLFFLKVFGFSCSLYAYFFIQTTIISYHIIIFLFLLVYIVFSFQTGISENHTVQFIFYYILIYSLLSIIFYSIYYFFLSYILVFYSIHIYSIYYLFSIIYSTLIRRARAFSLVLVLCRFSCEFKEPSFLIIISFSYFC